jgi:hypothetical protein
MGIADRAYNNDDMSSALLQMTDRGALRIAFAYFATARFESIERLDMIAVPCSCSPTVSGLARLYISFLMIEQHPHIFSDYLAYLLDGRHHDGYHRGR